MAKKLTLNLKAINIGPHENLNANLNLGNLEFGIYANNGSGKTFLSRAFRLLTKKELKIEDSNKLLTLGKTDGLFNLNITNSDEHGKIREIEFKISYNSIPVITKNTNDFIFRVFNDDFIKENLEISKYKPNGEIEGYILGKEKIDISKEKKELDELLKDSESKENEIKTNLKKAIQKLDELSIRKNTTEYQNVNIQNLLSKKYILSEKETFSELIVKHNQLKALPDNISDIKKIEFPKKSYILESIDSFLKESFGKSKVAEDFKTKIKNKQNFIESGLKIYEESKTNCPFCEQSMDDNALKLIDEYLKYFTENEAQQIKKSNDLISQLLSKRKEFHDFIKLSTLQQKDYLKHKNYIPSLAGKNTIEIDEIQLLNTAYEIIQEALEKKKENIELIVESEKITKAFAEIKNWGEKSFQKNQSNNNLIQEFNDKKNNTNTEKLGLNKRLCIAKFIELKESQEKNILELYDLNEQVAKIKEDILSKEQKEKVSKKDKVVETFKLLLTRFFGNKYSFDDDTFSIKFKTHLLKSNASDVLSDGEKSIVAFCYYIAETHKYIENENDYEKLFFIIDDPISSQDFHFVYATSQLIRNLNKLFKISRLRILLFTHNLEFMSILIRNKIVDQKYILTNGNLTNLGNELIMPYEQHLRDIYNIAKDIYSPIHTTPNSIRHVLETINRFVCPNIDLNDFCEKIDGFSDNEFLFSMMHDGSHGGIRLQKAYTEEMVKSACEVVLNFIEKDFKGQIKILENKI
jgi:hypothetical protein